MSQVQSSAFCLVCQQQRLFTKEKPNHLLHLVLSVLTLGIWAIFVWLPISIAAQARRPRCASCGTELGHAHVPTYGRVAGADGWQRDTIVAMSVIVVVVLVAAAMAYL